MIGLGMGHMTKTIKGGLPKDFAYVLEEDTVLVWAHELWVHDRLKDVRAHPASTRRGWCHDADRFFYMDQRMQIEIWFPCHLNDLSQPINTMEIRKKITGIKLQKTNWNWNC